MSKAGIQNLVVEAARNICSNEIVFAGVGLPIMAMAVAKKFYQPKITIVCESGVVDTMPTKLALSISDPSLVNNCAGLFTPNEIFSFFLQSGRIDVGIIGGAQIDRYGNVNSTVIGTYDTPKLRMPGSGGACEIASNSKSTIILMPQSQRRFVKKVDFVTSPGHIQLVADGQKLRGNGPRAVITDMGAYAFDKDTKEMYLEGIFSDVSIDDICANTGWPISISRDIRLIKSPEKEEIAFINALDPDGIFLGKLG